MSSVIIQQEGVLSFHFIYIVHVSRPHQSKFKAMRIGNYYYCLVTWA